MKYITFLNILAKSIFTVAIFIFVQNQSDVWKVPLLNSIGFLVAGILSIYIIIKNFHVKFLFQNLHTLILYIKEATHIFISNVAISFYTISTTFILGIFTNNTIVGYFSAAEKIVEAFKGLMGPVSQTIYPYISKKVHESKEEGLRFIRKVTFYVAIFTGLVSIFIFIFAEPLVYLILGQNYQNSIIVLKILSLMPFMIGLSNIFGIQTMLNFGRKKAFSRIIIIGSLLNLVLSFLLVPLFKHIGSALTVLIVESYITIAMFIYLQKSGLKVIGEIK